MSHYIVVQGSHREAVKLSPSALGSGGEASIHRVEGRSGLVAKLYRPHRQGEPQLQARLEAMMARPPATLTRNVGASGFPSLCWPTGLLMDSLQRVVGFVMPEMPGSRAVSLSKYMSRAIMVKALTPEDRSLPSRMRVCRNLAATLCELHDLQHYVVDIKPQNIFTFAQTSQVCIVDNDSFSIAAQQAGSRFAATALSSEYTSPELLRNALGPNAVFNDRQDRFALAVLVFQILNHGLHPFQGRPRHVCDEWNIDLCIREGHYPHGERPHAAIEAPAFARLDCLGEETLSMFEAAFTKLPSQRPTARQWREHFDQRLLAPASFAACAARPNDVVHLHMTGLPCPECPRPPAFAQSRSASGRRASSPPSGSEPPPAPARASAV